MAFICPKEPGGAAFHHRMHRDKAQVQKKKEEKNRSKMIVCFQGNCSNQFSPPGTIMGLNQKKSFIAENTTKHPQIWPGESKCHFTTEMARWSQLHGKDPPSQFTRKVQGPLFLLSIGLEEVSNTCPSLHSETLCSRLGWLSLLLLLRMKPKHVFLHPWQLLGNTVVTGESSIQ